MGESTLSIPAFLPRIFPIHDAIPAPLYDGKPLLIVENAESRPINYLQNIIIGPAKTCKTSLWWQTAMSYVSEGKTVLGICEKVEKKPNAVHGMPPSDLGASKKILLKYVKTREELVQALTALVELTKVSNLPDVILIDDLHLFTGSSDADADCDHNLAKVFAILKNVIGFIAERKKSESVNTDNDSTNAVSLVVFSAPLQSRGTSYLGVCQRYFDSIFEIQREESGNTTNKSVFSVATIRQFGSGYRFLFSLNAGDHIKLESLQLEVDTRR